MTLSPSRVNCYLSCSARWFYRYVERLPDPPSGSLVRGRAVHRLVNHWFRLKIDGLTPEPGELAAVYDGMWDEECDTAAFAADDDIEQIKASGAALAAKYLTEAAPDIEPAALDLQVTGEIGGTPVRGFIDLMDVNGTIVDLKTASRKPSGISPDYALQIATYAALAPGATGEVRLDTVVSTKQPQLVQIGYTVSDADRTMCERIYPHVQRGMEGGYYTPNRGSTFCSKRYCNFWERCCGEFGGIVA
jgi:putative RecB family exonuclease